PAFALQLDRLSDEGQFIAVAPDSKPVKGEKTYSFHHEHSRQALRRLVIETSGGCFLQAQNSSTRSKEVQRSGSKSGLRVQVVPCRLCCDLDASVVCTQPQAGRGRSNHDFAFSAFSAFAVRRDLAFTLRQHCSRTCAGHFTEVTARESQSWGRWDSLHREHNLVSRMRVVVVLLRLVLARCARQALIRLVIEKLGGCILHAQTCSTIPNAVQQMRGASKFGAHLT
ncbi:unnamed protein product, partial [Symbiodinium sp. CCMP2456]